MIYGFVIKALSLPAPPAIALVALAGKFTGNSVILSSIKPAFEVSLLPIYQENQVMKHRTVSATSSDQKFPISSLAEQITCYRVEGLFCRELTYTLSLGRTMMTRATKKLPERLCTMTRERCLKPGACCFEYGTLSDVLFGHGHETLSGPHRKWKQLW